MNIKFILLVCSVITIGIQSVATLALNSLEKVIDENDSNDLTPNDGCSKFLYDKGIPLFDGVNTPSSNESNRQKIQFHLFTKKNPVESYQLFVDDIQLLKNSPFNPEFKTKIIIHGFTDSLQSDFVQTLKNAYLENSELNLNVIAIDWSALAKFPWYYSSVLNTITVGKYVAKFVDILVDEMKLNLTDLHILGHSLGAHTAGIVGKNIQSSGKISRITGLDPALPLYATACNERKLTRDDAEFVDVIHTSGGTFALIEPVGDIDFYPNGGLPPQPGCALSLPIRCSHDRSWEFYAETLKNAKAFPTKACENLSQATSGHCDSYREGTTPYMGEDAYLVDEFEGGLFYTKTQSQSPFAINEID